MMPIGHLLRDKKGVISRSAELQDLLSIPGWCQIIRTGFLLSSCLWVPSLCQNFHLRTRLLCSLKNSSSLMNRVYCIHIPGLEPMETWNPWKQNPRKPRNRIPGLRGSHRESRNLIFNKNLGDFYDQANLESSKEFIHLSIHFLIFKMGIRDLHGGPVVKTQGARVQSLGRELDPTGHN